jgi:hypothetical protein
VSESESGNDWAFFFSFGQAMVLVRLKAAAESDAPDILYYTRKRILITTHG